MRKLHRILCIAGVPLTSFCQELTPKNAFVQIKRLAGAWEMKNPGGSNMKLSGTHIHATKVRFSGLEKLQSDWTGSNNGKNEGMTIFELNGVHEATIWAKGRHA